MTEREQIGARIKEAREFKGITQVNMAKSLMIARQTYLDLESGKTEPKATMLNDLSVILDRPIVWFVTGYADQMTKEGMDEQVNSLMVSISKLPIAARKMIIDQAIQTGNYIADNIK